MMIVLDAGAEDIEEDEDVFTITTAPDDLDAVTKALEDNKVPFVSAEISRIPQNYVDVTDPEQVKHLRIILDKLDESDDVKNVYHNWNEPDED